ncbi:MAG: hypothetical protein WDM86_09140 [Rhizomicrobium sp.]
MSRAANKASGRSPRRKAGRAAPKKQKVQHFMLAVDGQEMRVSYTPNWSDGEFAYGHFEFRSRHEPARRIPISETGYFSHFAPMGDILVAETPQDYARSYVETVIGLGRKGAHGDNSQLSLF